MEADRLNFLDHMRDIANASTASAFDTALEEFKKTALFQRNKCVQRYIMQKWIPAAKVLYKFPYIHAYM